MTVPQRIAQDENVQQNVQRHVCGNEGKRLQSDEQHDPLDRTVKCHQDRVVVGDLSPVWQLRVESVIPYLCRK